MDQFIKLILEEELSDKVFNQMEIRLFKFANKFKKELGTKDKMVTFFKNSLKSFNIPESKYTYYYEVYTLNYRPSGDYENVTKSEFKDPRIHSKQQKTSNSQSSKFVADKLPFKASNLEGSWFHSRDNEWVYIVESYGWFPIYVFKYNTWFQIDDNYSSSTSKHLSHSNPFRHNSNIGVDMLLVGKNEMNKIIDGSLSLDTLLSNRKGIFLSKLTLKKNEPIFTTLGWGDNKIKVTFNIDSVKSASGKPKVKLVVTNVQPMSDRKVVKDDGSFFRGEMNNINKDSITENLSYMFNSLLSRKLLSKEDMIDVNVSFDYNPNVSRPTSFWTFYNNL